MTLAEIRLLAKRRADMENSDFVSDAEWLTYLNGSLAELYDLLVTTFGADYYVAIPFNLTMTGVERYALPEDFYKLLGVDLQWPGSPTGYITLRPFNFAERNAYGYPGASATAWQFRYRLSGGDIWFRPTPAAGQVVQIHYIPRLVPLVYETDEVDGVSGWEELVAIDAARKALLKEESDTSGLEREKAALVARITAAAENRDAGTPATVVDTSAGPWSPGDPDPFGCL